MQAGDHEAAHKWLPCTLGCSARPLVENGRNETFSPLVDGPETALLKGLVSNWIYLGYTLYKYH